MDATDTAEPDEFARLLAQLNGTVAPDPVDAAPASPSPAAPPSAQEPPAPVYAPAQAPAAPTPVAPAAPALAAPVPAAHAPAAAAPAPAAAQPSVAPAFGVPTPYPPNALAQNAASGAPSPVVAAPLTFPAVDQLPATVAPVAPPPRAPELMGADELAAPPRSFPPLSEPAPALVSPPQFGGQPSSGADLPPDPAASYEPPQPYPPQRSATFASAPAPSAPALFAPDTAAPPLPAAAVAAAPVAAPAASHAPRDFASLLTTPVGGDDDPSAAAAPLRFGSAPADDDDEPDIGRATAGEKIGLVLAVLVAPIGLIVGIVAAVRSAHRRGWVIGIVRASIAIAAVFSVALGIGGYYGYTQLKLQQAHDQTAAASAAFCATIKANPSMVQLPTFGWPAVAASIPESLTAMQAYEDRWTKLAKVSPPGIKPGVSRVATAAKKIIDAVTVSRTVDDASNVAEMSAVASSSGVQGWYSEYCG